MRYKKEEVGKPTREMIEEQMKKLNAKWNIEDFITYWDKRDWHLNSLEHAVTNFTFRVYKKFNYKAKKKADRVKPTQEQIDERSKALAEAPVPDDDISKKPLKSEQPPQVKALKTKKKKLKKLTKTSGKKKVKQPKLKKEYLTYDEQLKDPRWFAFREYIFKVRGRKCEKCGFTFRLQVHHPKYKKGHLAWEYKPSEVIVLCRECHMKEHNLEPSQSS